MGDGNQREEGLCHLLLPKWPKRGTGNSLRTRNLDRFRMINASSNNTHRWTRRCAPPRLADVPCYITARSVHLLPNRYSPAALLPCLSSVRPKDGILDDISVAIGGLKGHATNMNGELDAQGKIIDEMNGDIDAAQGSCCAALEQRLFACRRCAELLVLPRCSCCCPAARTRRGSRSRDGAHDAHPEAERLVPILPLHPAAVRYFDGAAGAWLGPPRASGLRHASMVCCRA